MGTQKRRCQLVGYDHNKGRAGGRIMSIRLEHVSYAYEDNSSKKNYALKDVNLEIKKEEL